MCILLPLKTIQAMAEIRVAIAKKIACGVQLMLSKDPVIIHQDLNPLNISVFTIILSHNYMYSPTDEAKTSIAPCSHYMFRTVP